MGKHGNRFTKAAFLEPLDGKIKRKKFATVDIESKRDDTQFAGFTRPFLVGMFDPQKLEYLSFRNEPHLASRPWKDRHSLPGGCVDKLLNYILTKRFNKFVFYAHNGGKFDFLFFLRWLREHADDFRHEIVPIQSSIQVIRVWPNDEDPDNPSKLSWEFHDSLKIVPMALQKAAETFKLPQGKVQHDLNMHEDSPLWDPYLKQDCILLSTVVELERDKVEQLGGDMGMTLPATAMKTFRRQYLGKDGVPSKIARFRHWDDCASPATCGGCCHEWIRQSYFGGRTEMHDMGLEMWTPEELAWEGIPVHADRQRHIPGVVPEEIVPTEKQFVEGVQFIADHAEDWPGKTVHYYDINSSYVATMTEEMPIGNRIVEMLDHPNQIDWSRHDNKTHGGFIECRVEIPETCLVPPLPHPDEATGKLRFPVGTFNGVWPTAELALLRDPLVNGRIVGVKRAVWFEMLPMARKMMQDFWKLRDKTRPDYDEGMSAIGKLLGNSFYGKFGMKHEREAIVYERERGLTPEGYPTCVLCGQAVKTADDYLYCEECDGSCRADPDEIGDVFYQRKYVDAPYIIPHIASWITSRSRVRLFDWIKYAIEHGGKIYYLDTDSLITDIELPSSTRLGEMKNEFPSKRIRYLGVGNKAYMIDFIGDKAEGKRECEEGPGRATRIQPKVVLKGFSRDTKTAANFQRLRHGATLEWKRLEQVRTLARDCFRAGPKTNDVTKAIRSRYDKRELLEDGSTKPVKIWEPAWDDAEMRAAAE